MEDEICYTYDYSRVRSLNDIWESSPFAEFARSDITKFINENAKGEFIVIHHEDDSDKRFIRILLVTNHGRILDGVIMNGHFHHAIYEYHVFVPVECIREMRRHNSIIYTYSAMHHLKKENARISFKE